MSRRQVTPLGTEQEAPFLWASVSLSLGLGVEGIPLGDGVDQEPLLVDVGYWLPTPRGAWFGECLDFMWAPGQHGASSGFSLCLCGWGAGPHCAGQVGSPCRSAPL